MPFCIYCGHQNGDEAKFCAKCGKPTDQSDKGSKRKTVYDGEIHKCPNCGELLTSFTLNCPSCGYELRGLNTSSSVSEFSKKLEELERQRKIKSNSLGDILRLTVSDIDKKKISLIESFVIPNTKEDILEFMILASSNISTRYGLSASEKSLSAAWQAKFEQAYQKAEINFGNAPEIQKFKKVYDGKKKEMKRGIKYIVIYFVGTIALSLLIFSIIAISIAVRESKQKNDFNNEIERLNKIVQEVYVCIEEENYTLARAKASTIIFSDTSYSMQPLAEKWDKTREELLKIIEEKDPNKEMTEPVSQNTTEPITQIITGSAAQITSKPTYTDNTKTKGFIEGFYDGLQPGIDSFKQNIDEFNKNVNSGKHMQIILKQEA